MDFQQALALGAIMVSVLTLIYTMLRDRSTGARAQQERLSKLESEVLILKTQIGVFWRAIEEGAMKMLHHPDNRMRLDSLIDKYRAQTISDAEMEFLASELRRIRDDESTPSGESAMASLWLGVILSKQKEKELARSHSRSR